MQTVSVQIGRYLKANGVERVFSVTGGGAMFLNHAFHQVFGDHVFYMHHEQSCAMAAEGYARVTGKPAIVNVTTGPGAINALNGVFGAFTDSVPMIIISGQVKRETQLSNYSDKALRQLGDQEARIVEMATPICKKVFRIEEETQLENLIPEAFFLATAGRPGPVWIDIPSDIQMSKVELQFSGCPIDKEAPPPFHRNISGILLRIISECSRPIILAGTGIKISGTEKKLQEFSEKTGIPVATAWAHDAFDNSHEYYVGRPGTIGTRAGNFCLQNADLVIVLGSRLNIRQTSFNWASFAKDAVVFHVDIDELELNKFYLNSKYKVTMDLREFFAQVEDWDPNEFIGVFAEWREWCIDVCRKYEIRSENFLPRRKGLLNPYQAFLKLSEVLPAGSIVVCGNASACIIPFQCISLKNGSRMFSNSGSASMGYDLPAAIGARVGSDECDQKLPIICVAGDGSIQMNIQELQSIASRNLNIKIFVINNNGYLSIRSTHENFFEQVFGASPESGIDFPDFCRVASAYGIKSTRVSCLEDLASVLRRISNQGPELFELVVDPEQEFYPKLKSRKSANGDILTPELDDMYPFLPEAELLAIRDSAKKIVR